MLKFYIKKINNSYLLVNEYNSVDIEVDGKVIKQFKNGWLQRMPKEVFILREKERIIKYGSYSPEEYEKIARELSKNSDDDGYFSNIDEEYAYKKFKKENPPERELYVDREKPELIFYEITGRTDNKYIVPYRFIGNKDVNENNEVLYYYKACPYEFAQEIASSFDIEEVGENEDFTGNKWSVPSHSRGGRRPLEYVRIFGNYASTGGLPSFNDVSCGTYDECLRQYNAHYGAVKNMFEIAIAKRDAIGKGLDLAFVISELESIKHYIKSVDVKKSSFATYRVLISKVNELYKFLLSGGKK